ncbi:ribonuclease H1 domain-containing protein [Konateibacter massiliensis]|uniref:ribonuclease H1 domain-containing protein n=1 Tax=Konateibacter massiliensis TaxID=2002841 RepID=UPI000C149288|nr:viroplasmin family protein [Konateibacter massiliensis]
MAKKFYAVKVGKTPGIYASWTECQNQINGYSGAVYKGFAMKEEAEAFLKGEVLEKKLIEQQKSEAIAYVDGSYDSSSNSFSYGMVFIYEGKELHLSNRYDDSDLAEMNNVAGEIKGAEAAMQYCLENNIDSVTIYHDYEGIAKWCNGEWKAKKAGTIAYANYYKEVSQKIKILFMKVKAHSGDKYNEIADQLAKNALGIKSIDSILVEEKQVAKKKGIYIDREKIVDMIIAAGTRQWSNFTASELTQVGNAFRCVMTAEGKTAMLNIYFNNDRTTTITPTGNNVEISSTIKTLIESECSFSSETQGKTYSIKKLPKEWSEKIVAYLTSLDGVTVEHHDVENIPLHSTYVFTSKIGDRLTVNIYKTGTVTLQGKPAYLYSEAISFLSYCNDISVDDIVDSINSFHNVNVKTSEVRNEMETLLPRAYGNVDEMILKLLSPSISLRKVNIDLEDYSCYAFPALRALEGYIKYLFGLKNVTIGNTFYKIYNEDTLCPDVAIQIADNDYQTELERLYVYFKGNRHVIFHTDQILIGTTILEDKHEADEIINTVLNLIENSYTNINK